MRLSIRTAAIAASASVFFAAVGLAGPSLASEAAPAPVISYIDHADSMLPVIEMGINEAPAAVVPAAANAPTPLASHAIAPVFAEQEEEEPMERDGRSLDALVADLAATETSDEETECLARAVYYESKGESLTGQLSVAEVILNRTESGRFPSSICGVVKQRGQFSFVRGGNIPKPPASSRDWREAVAIARIAIQDLADGAAPKALFFHARHARPGWRLTRVATVGNHIFYR